MIYIINSIEYTFSFNKKHNSFYIQGIDIKNRICYRCTIKEVKGYRLILSVESLEDIVRDAFGNMNGVNLEIFNYMTFIRLNITLTYRDIIDEYIIDLYNSIFIENNTDNLIMNVKESLEKINMVIEDIHKQINLYNKKLINHQKNQCSGLLLKNNSFYLSEVRITKNGSLNYKKKKFIDDMYIDEDITRLDHIKTLYILSDRVNIDIKLHKLVEIPNLKRICIHSYQPFNLSILEMFSVSEIYLYGYNYHNVLALDNIKGLKKIYCSDLCYDIISGSCKIKTILLNNKE